MTARVRRGVLLVLLALSLAALWKRAALQQWWWGADEGVRALVGRPAPELPKLATLDGAPLRLADLRGRVVLLHFWTFG